MKGRVRQQAGASLGFPEKGKAGKDEQFSTDCSKSFWCLEGVRRFEAALEL